ncbi:MAG: glycosyltransferase family 4 protein [Chloroflexi bacterium]|nr:glycosyltransferase family 4 protein [Chloroflexota bacterium]
MRIGFDVSTIGGMKTGCGYFTDSLLSHLAALDSQNEYLLYPTFGDHYWQPDWRKTFPHLHRSNFKLGLAHPTYTAMQSFWSDPPPDFEAQLGNPHILHANNFFCPTAARAARVVYTLYDLSFIEHPDYTLEETRVAAFNGVFNASLYADHLIAISHYSRDHFLQTFPRCAPEKIDVVYPASRFLTPDRSVYNSARVKFAMTGQAWNAARALRANEFWLSVGTLEPRKNHDRLLQGYAALKASCPQIFPLVLVGARGWLMDDFEQKIISLGLQNNVIVLGYADDFTLHWLYQNCFAFLYPSLFEGFGLPVLEAMSLGAAVITSNVTSLPEIVGDAGILLDPLRADEIAQAMQSLLHDSKLREQLKTKAFERSQKFSWDTAARQVLKIYESLAI